MSTFGQLSHGLGRAWDSLAEGWSQLRERAGQAITRFTPSGRQGELETRNEQLERNASRWGIVAAEVNETDDMVRVRVEAPGMEPDDFNISVIDDFVVIRGEKQIAREEKQGKFYVMECAYGSFERAIPLPAPVDETGAKAQYRRGVLTVKLPKQETARARRIEVRT
jgi:HSP20 family protein